MRSWASWCCLLHKQNTWLLKNGDFCPFPLILPGWRHFSESLKTLLLNDATTARQEMSQCFYQPNSDLGSPCGCQVSPYLMLELLFLQGSSLKRQWGKIKNLHFPVQDPGKGIWELPLVCFASWILTGYFQANSFAAPSSLWVASGQPAQQKGFMGKKVRLRTLWVIMPTYQQIATKRSWYKEVVWWSTKRRHRSHTELNSFALD